MQSSLTLFLAAALLTAMPALAGDVPLPRPRPLDAEHKAPQPIATDPAAVKDGKKLCEELFKADLAVAALAEPIAWDNGCLAAAPVEVTAIKIAGGKTIELRPAAILRCTMAMAVANWVRSDLVPAARQLGATIERIDVAASFACRPRNNVSGAILSEHGKANALDIRAIHFTDGRDATIERAAGPRAFFDQMRQSACSRFMTVLGPGSDKPHETHLHVDLAERRNDYRICQWILPRPENATSLHEQAASTDFRADDKKSAKKK